jgi:hypothetical protein
MLTQQEADGSLIVSLDDVRWTYWLFGMAAIFIATAVYDLTIGSRGDDRLIGLAGASATTIIAGIVMRERSRFVFDPFKRTIVWNRTWGFRQRSGMLRFEDVEHLLVQTPIGDTGIPSRRICLKTRAGVEVPLTIGYRPDHGDAIRAAADRIRTVLGRQ